MKKKKNLYYSIDEIYKTGADYMMIVGERSFGKTYATLKKALERYRDEGAEIAYIRRYDVDITGSRGAKVWADMVTNGIVKDVTRGRYTDIVYFRRAWYFANWDETEQKYIKAPSSFARAYALGAQEHDKSNQDPNVGTIIFEEFISRSYLFDEFVIFQNLLSTIIRLRDNVKIFMLGNSISQYSPYFDEMGLNKIKDMRAGTIDIYTYGESDLKVAVELTAASPELKKTSSKYFAFNNPRLNMIRGGNGEIWELNIYPHCPTRYKPKDIIAMAFVEVEGEYIQLELINVNNFLFAYAHRKSTPLQKPERDILYVMRPPKCNAELYGFFGHKVKLCKAFAQMIDENKLFYQDNELGEMIAHYREETE